jgi:hypothetical protein
MYRQSVSLVAPELTRSTCTLGTSQPVAAGVAVTILSTLRNYAVDIRSSRDVRSSDSTTTVVAIALGFGHFTPLHRVQWLVSSNVKGISDVHSRIISFST